MILQALKEYYDRKAADPDGDIAPEGWEKKEIPFIVVLDNDGNLVQIEDTREGEGKRKRAKAFLVPRSVNRTIRIKANRLWDKAEYIFAGIDIEKDNIKLKRQREAFINKIESELGEFDCIRALVKFLKNSVTNTNLLQDFCWDEIKKTNPNIAFRFNGETKLICNSENIKNKIILSPNFNEIPTEELELCVNIIVVDAFIKCKIFKNPKGYNYASS